MRKKIFIGTIIILCCLYMLLLMPLPHIYDLWVSHTARHRMVDSVTKKVIGLSKDEIVNLLGEPDGEGGRFAAPGKGLYYVLGVSDYIKVDIFVIYLDENFTATECKIRKG